MGRGNATELGVVSVLPCGETIRDNIVSKRRKKDRG